MASKTLQQALDEAGNVAAMLRNSQIGAYVYPVVPAEFTNWRDEQWAWRHASVLFDQSHHMANLYVEGPDAIKLVSELAGNSFAKFPVDRAKQFAPTSYRGHVIGDGILFHLEQNSLVFVGRAPAANWLRFHGETGGYNVKVTMDDRSPMRPEGKLVTRSAYRYQIQGPLAEQVLQKLNGGPYEEIKFFNMGRIKIKGRTVRALRHGMAGTPGLEIWGPYEEREEIRAAIMEAGKDFGLRLCGSRAYSSNTLESGWIPSPLPAVYTDERMRTYREWLPAASYEGMASLGGSFVSDNIEDYYVTPYEMGYGSFMKFDHEFIGKDALQKMSTQPHRKKVTFEWNSEDVVKAFRSMFEDGDTYQYIDQPNANFSSSSFDSIVVNGKVVGASMFSGYSYNERRALSLGVVDEQYATPGTQVTLLWGEKPVTKKTTVTPHRQLEIRALVAQVPYSSDVRDQYYPAGWRVEAAAL